MAINLNNAQNGYTLIFDESSPPLRNNSPNDLLYVVGGGLLTSHSVSDIAAEAVRVNNPSKKPFHWAGKNPAGKTKRLAMLQLASNPAVTPIAAFCVCKPREQEEARRLCLLSLLQTTKNYDVRKILIESREGSLKNVGQNRIDSQAITQGRHEGIHVQAKYDWFDKTEPIGWLADAIVGAIAFGQRDLEPDDRIGLNFLESISTVKAANLDI